MNTTKPTPEEIAKSISLADQIAHVEFCAEEARHVGYAERAMELAVLRTLKSNAELLEALKDLLFADVEPLPPSGASIAAWAERLAAARKRAHAVISRATGATP